MSDSNKKSSLPELPKVTLQLVQDQSPVEQTGFLRLMRRSLVATDGQGNVSPPFVYDEIDRAALDAVVIVAHYVLGGTRHVYLRSAARPPIVLREARRNVRPDHARPFGLWELPAGLVEPDEASTEGIVRCAKRELEEELGFDVPDGSLLPLGPSTFPCPGIAAERHYYFHVAVEPELRREPSSDGSAIEMLGSVFDISLDEALRLCREGQLEDAKTELGLRRLAELPISSV